MENAIKLAGAIAWPIATIVVALVILVIVKMLLAKSGKIGLKWKDVIEFEADASEQIATGRPLMVPAVEPNPEHRADAVIDAPAKPQAEIMARAAVEEDAPADGERTAFARLWDATNLQELDAAFRDFKSEETLADADFWSGYYIDRKMRLGATGTTDELKQLAGANPTWVTPLTLLLARAVEVHDFEEAEALITQLLARRSKENSERVLRNIIKAYFDLIGRARAVEFYKDQVRSGITSSEQAGMLDTLASNIKSTDKFGFWIASEMAGLVEPGGRGEHFDLAYSYGDDIRSWALSYHTYQGIESKSSNYIAAANNMGVLLRGVDDKASLEIYDRAAQAGDRQASSNLARLLIEEGFISAGERLLDAVPEGEDGSEEHLAGSRAAALAARRSLDRRQEGITNFIASETSQFKATVARATRCFNAGVELRRGLYRSDDASFMILVDGAGAACQLRIGTLQYQGVLPPSLVGFDGTLQYPGAGLLSFGLPVSLLPSSANVMTALIWPTSKALDARMRYVELTYTEQVQALTGSPPGLNARE